MSTVILPYTELIIPAKGYRPKKTVYSPLLNTRLIHGKTETMFDFPSIVDSGADFCVFPAKYGSIIGLPIKDGRAVVTHGVGGAETLYFHKIQIGVIIRDQFREISFNQKKKMFRIKE